MNDVNARYESRSHKNGGKSKENRIDDNICLAELIHIFACPFLFSFSPFFNAMVYSPCIGKSPLVGYTEHWTNIIQQLHMIPK
jgi:hypothetical protein